MNEVTLSVETGREIGSAPSNRLRAAGKIPGTVYGMGQDAVSITVERSELRRALSTDAGINALLRLEVGSDAAAYALVKEIQRHPVRRDPIHVDFQRIDPEHEMSLNVPIVLVGDAKKVTSNGGMVDQTMQHLHVSVRPDSIPNEFKVDISVLDLDHHHTISVGDVVLPAGVTSLADDGEPVVVASLTRAALMAQREAAGGVDDDAEAAPATPAAEEG